jgi:hypothetical protein
MVKLLFGANVGKNAVICTKIPPFNKLPKAGRFSIFHPAIDNNRFNNTFNGIARRLEKRKDAIAKKPKLKKEIISSELAHVVSSFEQRGILKTSEHDQLTTKERRHARRALRLGIALREKGRVVRYLSWPASLKGTKLAEYLSKPPKQGELKIVLLPPNRLRKGLQIGIKNSGNQTVEFSRKAQSR